MSHLSYTITATLRFHLTSSCQKALSSFRKYAFKVNSCVTKIKNSHLAVKNWGKRQKKNLLNAILL